MISNLGPKIKKVILILIMGVVGIPGKSQDPSYSQFTHNPIYYNPAYTGISLGLRTRFNYRKQWPKIPGDFRSYNFNLDIASRTIPGSGGVGLLVDKHIAGVGYFERLKVGIPLAVRIPLYENMIVQMGVMTSFVQKSIDWNNLIFSGELHPLFGAVYPTSFVPPANNKIVYPDVDLGMAFRFVQTSWGGQEIIATTGIALHHVFQPNESFYELTAPLPNKLVITGDIIIQDENYTPRYSQGRSRGLSFKFNPGFIYQKQLNFSYYSFGLNVHGSHLYVGMWYRNENFDFVNSKSLNLVAGLNVLVNEETRMKIFYNYDVLLVEGLARSAGGTHEISIIFEIDAFDPFAKNSRNGGLFGNKKKHSALECSPF